MSIAIDSMKCRACGKCLDVCASCIKECPFEAISYYLGADIGGMGSQMTVHTEGDLLHWRIKKTDGTIETIVVNKKDSNKY